jgi:predicted RNA-binding protein YlxR (DUF448 family)
MLTHLDNTDLDAGPHRAAGRERLCVVTREVKPPDEMIRFVVGPDRAVVADLKRKLPGRGVWVTASRECLAAAAKRGVFARAFGADVTVAADLPDQVQGLLERAFLDGLAIARKAGEVVSGHAKVEAAAEEGSRRGLSPGPRCRTGGGAPDHGCNPARVSGRCREYRGDPGIYVGPIGFGTCTTKCGTCCPARGPRHRYRDGALAGPCARPGA